MSKFCVGDRVIVTSLVSRNKGKIGVVKGYCNGKCEDILRVRLVGEGRVKLVSFREVSLELLSSDSFKIIRKRIIEEGSKTMKFKKDDYVVSKSGRLAGVVGVVESYTGDFLVNILLPDSERVFCKSFRLRESDLDFKEITKEERVCEDSSTPYLFYSDIKDSDITQTKPRAKGVEGALIAISKEEHESYINADIHKKYSEVSKLGVLKESKTLEDALEYLNSVKYLYTEQSLNAMLLLIGGIWGKSVRDIKELLER